LLFLFRKLPQAMLKDPQAWITHIESWNNYFLFSIDSPEIAGEAKPGQFLMIKVNDSPYPLLRRPFSIHSRSKGIIEIFFMVSGQGTSLLAEKKTNEPLDILGPLGKGFRFDCGLKGKTAYLVGGGRGIAPLFFLAQELQSQGTTVKTFYGGQCLKDLPLREKFQKAGLELSCSSDDGSFGFRGFVSDLFLTCLEKDEPAAIFSCGPDPMMAKVARLALARNIPAQFSLESHMGCGFGACWGCVRRIKRSGDESWVKICEEGPAFKAEEIVWAEEER
jgi:dihydroorotate dehydrogenase electron transfer subunit